ncbi:MAG: DNA primase, partial [Planctomycetota bacterium]|nr:DNA primase [Planctomycetota bacterium]
MSFSSFDVKEQIRQSVDIVDLVGQYLQLRREGRILKALCPWHADSRPSLQVNPQRQSFKCWVCNIGGDIFSFLMKIENVDFPEALEMLAERANISLKPQRPATINIAQPGDASVATAPADTINDKRVLFRAMAWAEEQYHRYLVDSAEAEPARRYLDQRGITDESIDRYKLGYSPLAWDWIIRQARQEKQTELRFSERILERIGLLIAKENGSFFDRFRGRVLFSIRDPQSRPVAFGGRILPGLSDTSPAKYVNSPETPLFSKSKLLYGLDSARDAIAKTKSAVVMEGYTDVLVARQFGIATSIAVLGTALNERHIQVLRHYDATVTLLLDGDEAGQKRTTEILDLFIAEQIDLRIATLPDGLDPCDFLLERGTAEFNAVLAGAVDALEHAYRNVTRDLDIQAEPHRATQALDSLLQKIALAPRLRADTSADNRIRESGMLVRLARMFEVPEELLRQRVMEMRRNVRKPRGAESESTTTEPLQVTACERELLEILLLEPECAAVAVAEITLDSLPSPHVRLIFEKCRELVSE